MTDEEWAAAQVWRPQATEPMDELGDLDHWIEIVDGRPTVHVRVGRKTKAKVASMPPEVPRYVDHDEETWSELVAYARSLLTEHGTGFPISRVGQFLRDNGGRPKWHPEQSRTLPTVSTSEQTTDAIEPASIDAKAGDAANATSEVPRDRVTATADEARASESSPNLGEPTDSQLTQEASSTLLSEQLEQLQALAALKATGLLADDEVRQLKSRILNRDAP
jgi:hypothetical protein